MPKWTSQLGWFVLLWAAGVAVVGGVAFVLRGVLRALLLAH